MQLRTDWGVQGLDAPVSSKAGVGPGLQPGLLTSLITGLSPDTCSRRSQGVCLGSCAFLDLDQDSLSL